MPASYRTSEPSDRDSALLKPGDTLAGDRYRVERPIGRGRYAQVYLAVDRDLETHNGGDARVAIKILRPGYQNDTEAQDRLMRESDLQKTEWLGRHANIVPVVRELSYHEVQLPEQHAPVHLPFFVMAYIEGVTLDAYIRDHEGRAPRNGVLLRIFEQLGNALDWIHAGERPVVHRDLAAHNILLRCERHGDGYLLLDERADFVQVTDFGLAYPIGEPRITREGTGRIAANVEYASPEILQGADPTPQDDIYSLAVLAYEAYTGRLPFTYPKASDRDAYLAFTAAVQKQTPPFLPEDELPPAVREVLLKGLAKRRRDRYADARALAWALIAAAGGEARMNAPPAVPRIAPGFGFEMAELPPQQMPAAAPRRRETPGATLPPRARRPLPPLLRFFLALAVILALSALAVWAFRWMGGGLSDMPRAPAALSAAPQGNISPYRAALQGGAPDGTVAGACCAETRHRPTL